MRNTQRLRALLFWSYAALGLMSCGGEDKNTANATLTGGTRASSGGSVAAGRGTAGTTVAGAAGKGAAGASTGGQNAGGNVGTGGVPISTGGSGVAGSSTGGKATGGTGNPSGGRAAGGTATGGAGGAPGIEQTCADVCVLLASRDPRLDCEPSPCASTCVGTYDNLVAGNATCGSTYQSLLACGATKPADSWTCYTNALLNINIPVPPNSAAPDGCATEYTAFIAAVLANLTTCGTALGG